MLAVVAMTSPLDALIAKLETERKALDHEFKIELPKAIGIARDHGDLSENAEYHAARERHAFVKARIGQIDGQLGRLKSIDLRQVPRDRAGLYSKLTVAEVGTGAETEYQLVTTEEANADLGMLSISSPIGRGLVGKREGDTARVQVPSGTREFEILTLRTLHDLAGE